MVEHSPDKRETEDRYLVGTPNMGRMPQGVAADCKSVGETHGRFDSCPTHQNVALV